MEEDIKTALALKELTSDVKEDAAILITQSETVDGQIVPAIRRVPHAVLFSTDKTLAVTDKAADAKVTGDRIKFVADNHRTLDLSAEPTVNCTILDNNTYRRSASKYKSYQIKRGDLWEYIRITANGTYSGIVTFVTEEVPFAPTSGSSMSGILATGETGRRIISAGETEEFHLPSDCAYILITYLSNEVDYTPSATVVYGKLQEKLTFDSEPTEDSINPVTSGGVYTALGGKLDAEYTVALDWAEVFGDDENAPLGWTTGYYNASGQTGNSVKTLRTYRTKVYIGTKSDVKIVFTVPTGYHAAIIEYDADGTNGHRIGDYDSSSNVQEIAVTTGKRYKFCMGEFADGDAADHLTEEFLSTLTAVVYRRYADQIEDHEKRITMLESDTPDLPGYYDSYLQEKLNTITARRVAMSGNTDEFWFITDYHHQYNTGHSLAMLKYLTSHTGINKLFYAGDAGGSKGTSETAIYKRFQMSTDVWKQLEDAVPEMYGTTGNHEFISGSAIPYSAGMTAYVGRYKHAPIVMDLETGCYYVDNTANKVRYFFIQNTSGAYPTSNAIKWLGEQLLLVPEGYAVALTTHHAYIPSDATYEEYDGVEITYGHTATRAMSRILHAYMTKRSFTWGETYDYSSLTGNRPVVGIFCGHLHHGYLYTGSEVSDIAGINVFRASTDCMHAASVAVDGAPWYWENAIVSGNKVIREIGTTLEQCFYCIQFDLDSGDLFITAIGGDHDWQGSFQVDFT